LLASATALRAVILRGCDYLHPRALVGLASVPQLERLVFTRDFCASAYNDGHVRAQRLEQEYDKGTEQLEEAQDKALSELLPSMRYFFGLLSEMWGLGATYAAWTWACSTSPRIAWSTSYGIFSTGCPSFEFCTCATRRWIGCCWCWRMCSRAMSHSLSPA